MGLLKNKKILITGLLNKRSIAYGIAEAMYEQQASLAFTCLNKKNKNKIKNIVKKFNSNIVIVCDFSKDKNIKNLFLTLFQYWENFDGFIHSIAYAPKIQLSDNYLNTINQKDFAVSHNITSYSLVSMLQESLKQLNPGSSIVTLTYVGSQTAIPYYNIMGVAKASLESNVRYLANVIGTKQFRINAISAGPVKTTSSYHIPNFKKILSYYKKYSPIKRLVTVQEIGNTAAFLCSNISSGITGQVIYEIGRAHV